MPSLHPPFKSYAWAIILPLFVGPLGLLYSSLLGGLVMGVLTLVCFLLQGRISSVPLGFVWVLCVYWGSIAVTRYNLSLWRQMMGRAGS